MGVWIEIAMRSGDPKQALKSLPAWECGLKSLYCPADGLYHMVTPCVGVWIEMWELDVQRNGHPFVTPCVGVWIEMAIRIPSAPCRRWSLPAWECGLK